MPAADETRYNLKRLHKAFAAASIALLMATIWLLVEDHQRPWKRFQRKANDIELRVATWRRHQYETDEATRERERLEQQLAAVRAKGLDMGLVGRFRAEVASEAERRSVPFDFTEFDRQSKRLKEVMAESAGAEEAGANTAAVAAARQVLLDRMRKILGWAAFREANKLEQRRAKAVELEAAKASVGLAVRDQASPTELNRRQQRVDRLKRELRELTLEYEALNDHRVALQALLNRLTADEDAIRKTLSDNRAALARLEATMAERRSTYINRDYGFPLPGKKLLEMPIFDAFNSPLKIDNLWCDGLTQDYNFREVRRFDRCTTCHRAIQKSEPGSADRPGYPISQVLRFSLKTTVDGDEEETRRGAGLPPAEVVEEVYGLRIAVAGLIEPNDATVSHVRSGSPAAQAELASEPPPTMTGGEILGGLLTPQAAKRPPRAPAGLRMGDVLAAIENEPVDGAAQAVLRLSDAWAKARRLKDEGRQDEIKPLVLTVRRGLAHPYATHPRLDLYVGSLSPHKMSKFACTICHEGQGSATDFTWASHTPDSEPQRTQWGKKYDWFDNHDWRYPMYPRRFTESTCLKCHHDVAGLLPSERFPEPPAPKLIRGYNLVRRYGCFGCHEINGYEGDQRIGPDLRVEPNGLAVARNKADHPGQLRTPGPSLRFIGHKTGGDFLYDWIRNPRHFRPHTRMPRAFGLWNHLVHQRESRPARNYEPIEVLGIVAYLESRTEDSVPLDQPDGIARATPDEKAKRGKMLFQTRGCLVCHNHRDFPDAAAFRDEGEIVEGPDLSAIGDVLKDQRGRKWLYTWIKRPTLCDPRTVMPDMGLTPIEEKDEQGKVVARTDPVEDLVEYLCENSSTGYQPVQSPRVDARELDQLALEHLRGVFHEVKAREYLRKGIPERLRATLKSAETELLVADAAFDKGTLLAQEQKLRYIGHKSILKYGCHGCHDIPGFENAKPIGIGLADWGRKNPSQLAFEHVVEYLQGEAVSSAGPKGDVGRNDQARGPREMPSDYYMRQIRAGNRIGFLYQKLTEPRSFDYGTVENKGYNERLRMPQFPFTADQREAIMTFVLGLVAKPPNEKYIYRPDPRREAIAQGRALLDKYRCGGCHILRPEQWRISFPPDSFGEQRRKSSFPFALHAFASEQLEASAAVDHLGLRQATLEGMPLIGDDGQPLVFDDYGDELFEDERYDPRRLEYAFQLWKPAALDGFGYQIGESPLSILAGWIRSKETADGGFLARYLLPHVVRAEKAVNPNAKGSQAWGWLPPPLLWEGQKARPDWLHDYLLDPEPIRPAVVLRMPRFNLSPGEATTLAKYFAALDGAGYPHEFAPERRPAHLADAEAQYERRLRELSTPEAPLHGTRLGDAMRLVTDKNYCVTCHIVADFDPQTSDRAKGPDLAAIHKRIRPGYLRRWFAKPVSVRPYTGMPVNIPYDPNSEHLGGVDQNLYHGTSVEQLEAVVDLLLNFDQYAKNHNLVTPLVKAAATPATDGNEPAPADDRS